MFENYKNMSKKELLDVLKRKKIIGPNNINYFSNYQIISIILSADAGKN
jgi:hypothetical protein